MLKIDRQTDPRKKKWCQIKQL